MYQAHLRCGRLRNWFWFFKVSDSAGLVRNPTGRCLVEAIDLFICSFASYQAFLRVRKFCLVFNKFRHMWCLWSIRLSTVRQVCTTSMSSGLLYGSQARSSRTEDMRKLVLFQNRGLRCIVQIGWECSYQHHLGYS